MSHICWYYTGAKYCFRTGGYEKRGGHKRTGATGQKVRKKQRNKETQKQRNKAKNKDRRKERKRDKRKESKEQKNKETKKEGKK